MGPGRGHQVLLAPNKTAEPLTTSCLHNERGQVSMSAVWLWMGMAVVSLSAFYFAVSIVAPKPSVRAVTFVIGFALWCAVALPLSVVLGVEVFMNSEGCLQGSKHAAAGWTWVGPGVVCEYTTGTHRPSPMRLVLLGSLIGVPIATGYGHLRGQRHPVEIPSAMTENELT